MKKQNQAFTLIELLVAVTLMLLLVGAVATIFKQASNAMLLAESSMSITQNGRAIMETMSRDLIAVQPGTGAQEFKISKAVASGDIFLEFDTITTWRSTPTSLNGGQGRARVCYKLDQKSGRWRIARGIKVGSETSFTESVIGEYVATTSLEDGGGNVSILVEYYDSATKLFVAAPAGGKSFTQTDLPSGIRVSMALTNRGRDFSRPFSQVFWLAAGVH